MARLVTNSGEAKQHWLGLVLVLIVTLFLVFVLKNTKTFKCSLDVYCRVAHKLFKLFKYYFTHILNAPALDCDYVLIEVVKHADP